MGATNLLNYIRIGAFRCFGTHFIIYYGGARSPLVIYHPIVTGFHPLALILLRLVYLHGVKQRELAISWHFHEATVRRLLSHSLQAIREEALAFLRKSGSFGELEWSDLVAICEDHVTFLYQNQPWK